MPAETFPHIATRYTSAMQPIKPRDAQPTNGSKSIDRRAYWSAGKRFGKCDVCGNMETIQGEVRTLVDGVLTRSTAVGDCGQWMFETEQMTDAQKELLLAAAAKGKEVAVPKA